MAYRGADWCARALPESLAGALATLTGLVLGRAMRGRRDMMQRHLRRILGPDVSDAELARHVRLAFRSYARYWLESFRLRDVTAAQLEAGMICDGLPFLQAARDEGRGVIMCMPHLGGWDFGGAWLASIGYPLTVVVEPVEPPELFEWFAEFRQGLVQGIDKVLDRLGLGRRHDLFKLFAG